MNITAKDTADFYNKLFFDEEKKLVNTNISLFIRHGENELMIPDAEVSAKTEFHQIILDFHNKLLKADPWELSKSIPEPAHEDSPELNIIDFKRIEYRKNVYFVEQLGEEEFRVLNEERTKEINLKSPTAKAILKRFKES